MTRARSATTGKGDAAQASASEGIAPAGPAPSAVDAGPVNPAGKGGKSAKLPKAAKPSKPSKPSKAEKAPKPKLVRDGFTIPKDEYQVLETLKVRALGLEQHVRKSELLRAGIKALNGLSDRAFLKALAAVPTLKTGRPKSGD